ncbi:MAG TPA: pyruvate kinase, partial [Flavobacteriales bacterium]|nr:pyruvate kinase [Flavobacteriales bacterium]
MNKQSLFPIKQTKIIATIGPATSSLEMLEQLLLAGMNVIRINSSHGKREINKEIISNIRKLDNVLNTSTSILIDLQGPKLRIGEIAGGQIELVDKEHLV